jgi:hypothetical protein
MREEQGSRVENSEGIVFIGFIEFLVFVGLVKPGSVENCIPFPNDNSINTTNTRNSITTSGLEDS